MKPSTAAIPGYLTYSGVGTAWPRWCGGIAVNDETTLDPEVLLGARVKLPEHVVHRSFATEMVVLNLNTGRYHGLNPTAGRMLEVLQERATVRDAVMQLSEEFDVPGEQVEGDVVTLCGDLLQRGLITLDRDTLDA